MDFQTANEISIALTVASTKPRAAFKAVVDAIYLKHSDGSFAHLSYLERFIKNTDLNRIHGPKDECEFLCQLRGTVTGELR